MLANTRGQVLTCGQAQESLDHLGAELSTRSEVFTHEALDGLYLHHPYLLLFQKEDWKEYLSILGQIYDFLEDENVRVPYEAIRTLLLKFYASKGLLHPEQKIFQFFQMAIGELQVLKDSHDQFGQRFLETTRAGKMLLQLVEGLLERRVKYSGTGAETLLGALNDIILSQRQLSVEDAVEHHQEKIRAFKKDIERIKTNGLAHAELLPIPHSNEALFTQAEEAAFHILSSIEDVKTAVERQRQDLAQSYFEGTRTAGQNLNAIADFYERLYASPEYQSYNQAKALLSFLEGYSARFGIKNVDHLLHRISARDLVPSDALKRSALRGFMQQFEAADHGIQEKVRAQIKLLQQQVHYAINTDVHGLQSSLHDFLSVMMSQRGRVIEFFDTNPLCLEVPVEFEVGSLGLSKFEIPPELSGSVLEDSPLDADEAKAFFLALLRSEETTLQSILERFLECLAKSDGGAVELTTYSFEFGLAEYYVLGEIDLFDARIVKEPKGIVDLSLRTKHGEFIVRGATNLRFSMRTENGVH